MSESRPAMSEQPLPHFNEVAPEALERELLIEHYDAVRARTEQLAAGLSAEDQNLQSMAEASPVKWHRAHTSWFFETFILKPHTDWRSLDEAYNYLFNSYYNGIGEQYPRARRGLISQPDVEQVAAYRRHVDAGMRRLLETCRTQDYAALAALTVLGLNHEQQHQELVVTDLKHGLWQNPLYPAWTATPQAAGAGAGMRWHGFSGGIHFIGHDNDTFCFDNETPPHRVILEDFELASRPVTCGEYLAFIEDGGYRDPSLWLADGWAWVCECGIDRPLYWLEHDGEWRVYTCGGLRPLDPHEPVCHVSFYEAQAFAAWAGARLPTEAEWEVVAGGNAATGHFADHGRLHPLPATASRGPAALFGDVWEWTASSYAPYPGFHPAPGTVGEYNGKFMANQMVLRGGSCATPPGHVRASYRNFFYPRDRWQFSGLRLARAA